MIKIRITSPFRYQFRSFDYDKELKKDKLKKDIYFAAGDYYHLDIEKDIREIKYILGTNFAFKNYIYIELNSIPTDIKKELELEEVSSVEKVQLRLEEEYIPTLIKDNKFIDTYQNKIFDELNNDPTPTAEANINKFDVNKSTYEVNNKTEEVLKETPFSTFTENTNKINTPTLEIEEELTVLEEDLNEESTVGMLEQFTRREELSKLHFSKIKDICELYKIEYTNKKEVIEAIIKLEFTK